MNTEHRPGSKIQTAKRLFSKNLPILPKSGPTAFRQRVLRDIQSETGASPQSAPGLYNQAREEALEAGLVKPEMLERGTGGRGLKLNPEMKWTVVLSINNSPVQQFENRNDASDFANDNPGTAVRMTSTVLRAREQALAA